MAADHTTRSARRRRHRVFWLTGSLALLVSGTLPSSAGTPDVTVSATVEAAPSDSTGDSVDDMAIWVDTADPTRSVVIGADHGAHTIDVYDLTGARLQHLDLGDANNVDLRTGFTLGGATIDLVGVAGGGHSRGGVLRFFRLDPATRKLENVTVGGEFNVPSAHGFCMYHSAVSGKFYAFRVAPSGILQQFELFDDAGLVNARPAGEPFDVDPQPINANSNDAVEGCTTDDQAGSLFIGEQDWGIWKYSAEPAAPRTKADRVLVDGTDVNGGHITADVEGLTIVHESGGDGFLLASSQGDDSFNVYRRKAPHQFVRKVRVAGGPQSDGCERTDGIDAVAANLGPAFPKGLFVCQDNHNTAPAPGNQNFKYVPLEQVVPLSAGAQVTPPTSPPPGPASAPVPTPDPGTGPPAPSSDPTSRPSGYWMLGSAGRVYAFGDARPLGDPAVIRQPNRAVDLEPTSSGQGYWVIDAAGAVFAYGDAPYLGGVGAGTLAPGEEVTSMSAAPTGNGYWIFTTLGRVMRVGDAPHLGDMTGTRLNAPVLDSIATPTGAGYYMVASDGGIFSFGDARFFVSMGGIKLNAPVQSLVPDPDGAGYWLVAADGGVFAFDAGFRGSMGATRLNRPVTGMVAFGNGYLMVGTDGGIFNFSDRPFHGSLGADPPPEPITSVAALP
ncbi:MAG: phytase [Actinomycetota bacterium]|nr:phytase [Actinomycetota bacterium]